MYAFMRLVPLRKKVELRDRSKRSLLDFLALLVNSKLKFILYLLLHRLTLDSHILVIFFLFFPFFPNLTHMTYGPWRPLNGNDCWKRKGGGDSVPFCFCFFLLFLHIPLKAPRDSKRCFCFLKMRCFDTQKGNFLHFKKRGNLCFKFKVKSKNTFQQILSFSLFGKLFFYYPVPIVVLEVCFMYYYFAYD